MKKVLKGLIFFLVLPLDAAEHYISSVAECFLTRHVPKIIPPMAASTLPDLDGAAIPTFEDNNPVTAGSEENAVNTQLLIDNTPFYDEPSFIYHGALNQALRSLENGWVFTNDHYASGQSFDQNDTLRSVYSDLIKAVFFKKNLRFGDLDGFKRVLEIYESALQKFPDQSHPLFAYIYLDYILFINMHTISTHVHELSKYIEDIICYLASHWRINTSNSLDAIAYLQVQSYKALSICYTSYANNLYRRIISVESEQDIALYTQQREKAIEFAEQYINNALRICTDNKERTILKQKHLIPLEKQRTNPDRIAHKECSNRTTHYAEQTWGHLQQSSFNQLTERFSRLISGSTYLVISPTRRPWFKPVVQRQSPRVQHSQDVPRQEVNQSQVCLCNDCCHMRTEVMSLSHIPQAFESNEHLSFVVCNLLDHIQYFHANFQFLDREGKTIIHRVINQMMGWERSLSHFEINVFIGMQSRINTEC